jgi:hypothetical protein
VEQAIEACRSVEDGLRIERTTLRRSWGMLVAASIVTAIALAVGPRSLRYGATALALPARSADDVSPYAMDVVPGDITVARSSDQSVRARSVGFEAETIELLMRPAGMGEEYQRLPMFPDADGMHEVLLLDLREDVEYFVRSGRVRSPVYTIRVEDLPYAENIEVEYVFPEYTGLEPLVEEDGGDIAALSGTTVNLRITPTIASPGGQMVMVTGGDGSEDRTDFELTADGTGDLLGSFRVGADGRYSIRLATGDGRLVDASPEYFIDALADQPPTLQFTEPGRDESATAIEEVFLETRVQDDYGVGPVDLLFSINGGDEETVRLGGAGSPGLRDATSSYTLYLEEYEMEPGDLVAYHARTEDPGTGVEVESDLYFIQIRPFRTDVRQAEGGGAGGGGGEGGGAESALAERQRQITVGTFNLIRDREDRSPAEIAEDVATLAQAQTGLRAETQAVAGRAGGGGGASIATLLREAAEAMGQAIEALEAERPDSALRPEQVALQKLQAATEALSEMQVSSGGQGGGGGAGQALDELDLDSSEMRNQYESVRRGQQEQVDQEIDETLERLKELARRQEQEAERQRRMGEGAGSSASGERQRAMADEAEEAARQLERLSRDSGSPEIMESARRLREAAESMRRSAAGQGTSGSEATSAADQLEEARRQLERAQGERLQDAGEETLRRIEDLQRRQERMGSEVDGLDELSSAGQREERTRRLLDQKGAMGEEIQDLETTLDRLAAQGREEQPQAARAFEEAAEGIRDDRLSDKVQYSQGLIRDGRDAEAARFEDEIGQDLERLRDRVEAAVGAFENPREDRLDQAASEARRLVQGLEAMERSGREGDPGDRADPGQQGQQGQAGQDGGQGEQGEQARTGQQSQTGQQGQSGGQPGAPGVGRPGVGEGQANRALTPDEIRQMRGEARQREAQARDLRDRLEAEGFEAEALDGLVENLQRLDSEQAYDDREALTRLQQEVLQDARRFEYALRRAMQRDGEGPPSLSGNEDVPSSYRALVEEYFRALSEREAPGDSTAGG